ncbi:Oidioi.mRNA.OKI2018_I69.chr1.g3354.t1.cds [Oikopleura dioica]|uniref:Oidioi.mRNA.OKI2018_I69.chr1.g3354.t1.cds n=1 Tax=Oikopleura dioica TaxID=34765 RepID=A0ABN7STW3_OIKDI|nr:Oidioi.mRNA.OKI2018_I69.chr1.g3354.t1.cds [Oikopleura dioica]
MSFLKLFTKKKNEISKRLDEFNSMVADEKYEKEDMIASAQNEIKKHKAKMSNDNKDAAIIARDIKDITNEIEFFEEKIAEGKQAKASAEIALNAKTIQIAENDRILEELEANLQKRKEEKVKLDDDMIERLKNLEVKQKENDDVPECPVCFNAYNDGENQLASARCGHMFCNACIRKLVQDGKNCSMCDKKIEACDVRRHFMFT